MQAKKRVLLTTSAAPSQSPFSTSEKRPPLGIGYLISVLRDAGHEVFFIDNYLSPSQFLETDYLQRNRIDFVGIYANTICFRDTLRMVFKLDCLRHSKEWKGKIIVGGPHTTVAPETIPPFVDFVVQGEGEKAILEIVDGKITTRLVQYPAIKNLDELPTPSWDYFVPLPYKWTVDWFEKQPVFTMNTSRGCPFQCTFCSVSSIWGKKYAYFSAERVVSEIEYLVQHYGAKGVYFREDNFTLNKKRLESFCNLIINKNLRINWACESRVDTLDEEVLKLMYQAGARAFYFGVESGSQKILDFLKKGIRIEQVKKVFKLCQEIGFKTAASIIHGVPNETEDDLQKTEELLKEIKPDVIWRNVFVGIPNSDLYQYALKNNLHEFIDDRGLVYLRGHNQRVKRYYGSSWDASIPVTSKRPNLSVVMSVYNAERHLERAVRSVLNQTYQNFEFIIIDDASTDQTKDLLRKIKDMRVKIIRNEENLGLTKSLNKAIQIARGQLIARMDGDDLSVPHRFEKQLDFLKKHTDYAVVGSSYYQINQDDCIVSLVKVLTDDTAIKKGLEKQNWFGHGSVMMRKEAFNKVGGYDERFIFAQDYDLWLRISEHYKVANIEEPLYFWRVSGAGISTQKEKEQKTFAQFALAEAHKRRVNDMQNEAIAKSPMVSVIVPTYNRPHMLSEALKSIVSQTYKNYEIIVINDGGEDVEKVVANFNDRGCTSYVKHGKNRGLAAARNTGIKIAKGKYVAYLDDDDVFYPEHLETLVKFLISGESKVAYTDAHRAHHKMVEGKYFLEKKDVPYSCDFNFDRILRENYIPVLCIMHEKSCFDRVGVFDETLASHEDWDLWMRMSREFKFLHIPKVTCAFSWREDGSTMTSGQKQNMLLSRAIVSRRGTELQIKKASSTDGCDRRGAGIQYDKIQSLMESQKWEESISELEDRLAVYPNNAVAHNDLAVLASQKGDWEKALCHYERAVELDPTNLIFKKNLGEFYFVIRKDFKSAVQILLEVLKAQPTDIETLALLGIVCLQSNREKDAEVFFRQAAELDPTNEEVYNLLVKIREKNGSPANQLQPEEKLQAVEFQSKNIHDLVSGNFNNARDNKDLEFGQGYPHPVGQKQSEKDIERSDKLGAQAVIERNLSAIGSSEGEKPIQTTCSIVIPLFNKVEFTRKCIEAIRKNTPLGTYEIIIIDNASSDGTGAYLASCPHDIRVMTNSKNVGFTAACNQGAKTARGKYVLFLNNDTEPQPSWLDPMIELMESDPTIGITGSKLVYPDGRLQEAGGIIFNDGSGWNYGRFGETTDPAFNFVREVDYVSGASLLIRHSLLKKLNYFDERYAPGYYEDTDLCFAVRACASKVVYCPFSVVIHHEGVSSGNDLSQGMKRYQGINKQKFTDKWAADLSKQHAPSIDIVVAASERSTKGNILVIDPLLPLFDRAAGSLRLFTILMLLRAKGYHVTYIARDGRGQERYANILQKAGIEVYATDPEMLARAGQTVQAKKIDLNRILSARQYQFAYLSFYPIALQYCDQIRLASPRTRIIVDSVDIHFVREMRQAELTNDASALQNAEITKKNELKSYATADAVVTITEQDWDHIKDFLPDKPHFVIPNIHSVNERPPDLSSRGGLLFVGNFNHTPNLDAVLYCAKEILPIVRKTLPDMTLTIVGNNPPKDILALQSTNIFITGYVPSVTPYLEKARVSIAPLRYGAGMKGKIGEAMAHGLPVVTTGIGAEGMGLVSGETAFIANTPGEFAKHIITLCTDDTIWRSLASAAKQFIVDYYSPQKVSIQLEKILQQAASLCPPEVAGKEQNSRSSNDRELKKGLVSIVILTFNQLKYTKECVESIRKHTPEQHEIIFVDNGSTDGTKKWLRRQLQENPHYRLIENKANLGFAKGCNQGIAAARGEYLLLLNNDVVVTPHWLFGMLECLNRNSDIGIVGPMTNQISGIQKIPQVPYQSLDQLEEFVSTFREKNRHRRIPSRRIVGFCMLFRKELVDQIGLIDESFGTGNFEDDDFCLRAELAGFRNVIAGDVFIHHFGSRTFIGNQIDYRASMGGNKKRFFEKWKGIDYKSPLGRKLLSLQEKEEAWKWYHQDELEKSAGKFLTAVRISPQDEDLYLSFADMLIDAKKHQEGFDILKQMPSGKKEEQRYAFMGYCLEGVGKIQEAEKMAEKSISLKPENPLALNLKGILAYREGKKEEASGSFEKAIQADSGYGEPHTNLGAMKWETGGKEEALNFLERGFLLSPASTDHLQLYHSAVCELGAFERAEKFFAEAEAFYPSHKKLQYLLMDILLRQGKNEEAMERIEKAIVNFGMDEGIMKAALEVRKKIGLKEISQLIDRKTISLCMIVKNEVKNLAKCLQSIQADIDEIIIVDTGSTDRTKELATIFGAKIFDFAWENDFSSARNYSLSKASGDWILVLDADEKISEGDHHILRKIVEKSNEVTKAFSFVTRNYVNRSELIGFSPNDGAYPEEAGLGWIPSEKVRLFPNDCRFSFENPIHEIIRPALERNQVLIQNCPIPIHHYGKLDSRNEEEKGEYYYALGKKRLETHSDISSLSDLAVQAGALGHFEEAIGLWNKVLTLEPKMTDAHINLSYNHLKLKKYAEAVRYAQQAVKLDPQSKEALLNYSSAEFFRGNIKQTISCLEKFLPIDPEYPPILGLLSLAYFLDGRKEKNFLLVDKLKKMGFNYQEYVINSAQELTSAGQDQKAKRLLEMVSKTRKSEIPIAEIGAG